MQITDNTILTLTSILAEATASEDAVCYVTSADAPALKEAIEIMRKYQEIQEILKWNTEPYPYYRTDGEKLRAIIKVVEDEISEGLVFEESISEWNKLSEEERKSYMYVDPNNKRNCK